MPQVQYASSDSPGCYANMIGWITFPINFILSTTTPSPISMYNDLPGGFRISFDISLTATTCCTSTSASYISSIPPTSPFAPFGNTAYRGITEPVALTLNPVPTNCGGLITDILIDNIMVTDCCYNPICNFIFVVADAGVTNKGIESARKVWQLTTNGTPWQLLETMPSLTGERDDSPTLEGLNTKKVTEVGRLANSDDTSANIFATSSPCQVTAEARVDRNVASFAFGIIIPCLSKCGLEHVSRCNINYIFPHIAQMFCFDFGPYDRLLGITYNGIYFNTIPITIEGTIGTYTFTNGAITVLPFPGPPSVPVPPPTSNPDLVDAFFVHIKRGSSTKKSLFVFASV